MELYKAFFKYHSEICHGQGMKLILTVTDFIFRIIQYLVNIIEKYSNLFLTEGNITIDGANHYIWHTLPRAKR